MKSLADTNVRVAVVERIGDLSPQAGARWGKMNAHQMLCHCNDALLCAFGEKEASPATGVFQRTVMKTVALWVPAPWPKGIPTRPEVDQTDGTGTRPVEFVRDRLELIRQIERFCNPNCDLSSAFHPFFGLMSEAEWKRWGYLHLDHHLRQFGG
ncbi:MAG: DUF1569 domain-containing protein [Bryobacteraceae bacterium]|nr:DUF1569 domain-containing protein [Bryobacteraceae bacterium]